MAPRRPGDSAAGLFCWRESRMRHAILFSGLMLLAAAPLSADTIFQTNAQGKQVVVQRDAIVVKEDSSFLIYKHFELKERRGTKVTLNKGSLPYAVAPGTPAEQQQIVDTWKRFGYKATATDLAGKTTRVSDAYLD